MADNTNLYVFGGYNPDYDESGGPENEDYPLFRELWRYHFATGTWHQMGTDGYMPRELASMSCEYCGGERILSTCFHEYSINCTVNDFFFSERCMPVMHMKNDI